MSGGEVKAPRKRPALPRASRFSVGDLGRIKETRITFEVAAVSGDGERIETTCGRALLARMCEVAR